MKYEIVLNFTPKKTAFHTHHKHNNYQAFLIDANINLSTSFKLSTVKKNQSDLFSVNFKKSIFRLYRPYKYDF